MKVVKYQIQKDLKMPSIQKMTTTMIECMMPDQETLSRSIKEYKDRMYLDTIVPSSVKNIIISNPNVALTKIYSSILRSRANDIGDLGAKIHEKLKEEGYGGIPDLNDVHFQKDRMTPTFIFDRKEYLKKDTTVDSYDIADKLDDLDFKYERAYKY